MRFVKDDGVRGRQQLGHAGVLEHDIGEEQVVIDDHHVGLLRLLAGAHDEAVLVVRALRTEAVVARGRDQIPHRRVLGHGGKLGLVARLGGLEEAVDLAQPRRVLPRRQPPVLRRALQVVMADVVGPPLQQRHRHRCIQGLAHGRDIAQEQLVLQVLGPGGQDHLAAPQHRRNEVGVGLARAGARLDDQRIRRLDGIRHRLRHRQLRCARPVRLDALRQRAVIGEQRRQFGMVEVGGRRVGKRGGIAIAGIGRRLGEWGKRSQGRSVLEGGWRTPHVAAASQDRAIGATLRRARPAQAATVAA